MLSSDRRLIQMSDNLSEDCLARSGWETLQCVGDDGDAVLDAIDVYPTGGGHEEFFECMAAAALGKAHVAAPPGAHGSFQPPRNGPLILDADLTPQDVADTLANCP